MHNNTYILGHMQPQKSWLQKKKMTSVGMAREKIS